MRPDKSLKKTLLTLRTVGARTAGLLPGTSIQFGPPRKIATTLTQTDRTALIRHNLVPARTSVRSIPEISDPPLDKWMQTPCRADVKEIFTAELPQGRYWGRYHGYIIDRTDTLLSDLSPTFTATDERHDGLNHPRLPPLQEVKGTVAVINTFFADNFHHWLLDTLPRFEWLRRSGWAWKDIDYFILPPLLLKFHWETLEILGIDKNKIIASTPDLHLRADRLLAPCHSEPSALPLEYDYTPEGLQFVRSLFLTNNPFLEKKRSTKILVSREKAAARRVVQADRTNELLFAQGFEKILLEDHSLLEQAAIFNQADCVVMPTGGNLANFVFCQPGTVAIELFSKNYIPPFTFSFMDNIGLRYYGLVADKISRPKPEARTSSEDIDFDPERLAQITRDAMEKFERNKAKP